VHSQEKEKEKKLPSCPAITASPQEPSPTCHRSTSHPIQLTKQSHSSSTPRHHRTACYCHLQLSSPSLSVHLITTIAVETAANFLPERRC
jgi:hypothetical protein